MGTVHHAVWRYCGAITRRELERERVFHDEHTNDVMQQALVAQ